MTIQNETQVGEANYLELAKLYQTDFSNRRSLEWQLSLGLWGGLAAFAYAFAGKAEAQNKIAALIANHPCSSTLVCVAIVVLHGLVILALQDSHARNRDLYWWFVEKTQGSSRKRPWPLGERPSYLSPKIWSKERFLWFAYHLLATVLVIVVVREILSVQVPVPS